MRGGGGGIRLFDLCDNKRGNCGEEGGIVAGVLLQGFKKFFLINANNRNFDLAPYFSNL